MSTDEANMIARIDERTQLILEMLDKKASQEAVDAVAQRLEFHETAHVSRGGLFAAWGGTALAAGIAIFGIFRGAQ